MTRPAVRRQAFAERLVVLALPLLPIFAHAFAQPKITAI
jgi:hypothetical protein